jgi:hypothetical protein
LFELYFAKKLCETVRIRNLFIEALSERERGKWWQEEGRMERMMIAGDEMFRETEIQKWKRKKKVLGGR